MTLYQMIVGQAPQTCRGECAAGTMSRHTYRDVLFSLFTAAANKIACLHVPLGSGSEGGRLGGFADFPRFCLRLVFLRGRSLKGKVLVSTLILGSNKCSNEERKIRH